MRVCMLIALFLTTILPIGGFANEIEITGAGATFPYPLYSKMFDAYYKQNKVRINYQAIGSGGGIRQLLNKTVDFGASDAFMTDSELKETNTKILHIPICLGSVVVTYNLADNPKLKLTPDILADIFLGNIKKWDDERIRKINPSVKLQHTDIIVIHRSDGSGTTSIFTDYLSKVSEVWKQKVGADKSVNWPVGLGGKGNAGVMGLIKQMPGSIGYVELSYALQNNMPTATLKNKRGKFIDATISSTSESANIKLTDDMRVSLTDSNSANGYPISGFTWVLIYKDLGVVEIGKDKEKELVRLLNWMIHEGQKYAEPLYYSPLPKEAVKKAENIIKSIKLTNS